MNLESSSVRRPRVSLVLAVVAGLGYAAYSQGTSVSASYPSPSGVYKRLITTGLTILARNEGAVGIGTATPDPAAKLDVAGRLRVSAGGLQVDGPAVLAGGVQVNGAAVVAALRVSSGAQAGRVLTADASGNASWQAPQGGAGLFPAISCPSGQVLTGITAAGQPSCTTLILNSARCKYNEREYSLGASCKAGYGNGGPGGTCWYQKYTCVSAGSSVVWDVRSASESCYSVPPNC